MKFSVEFEIEKHHCLYCPFREQTGWNWCMIQKDNNGHFLEFDTFTEQMKKCPLKKVDE